MANNVEADAGRAYDSGMDSKSDAQEIANRLVEVIGDGRNVLAYIDYLGSLWAEDLWVTHVPPMTNDGLRVGPELRVREHAMNERFLAAMPDYRQEDVTVGIDGDVIYLHMTWAGTRADGSEYRMPVEYAVTVDGGILTRCVVTVDPDHLPQVADVGVEHWLGEVRAGSGDAAS
jgi:ketosteroid isomerase-like protein